jgi:putative phosphoribosyl transferase
VAPADTLQELESIADRVVCLSVPRRFGAVGAWYHDFPQVSTRTVRDLVAGGDR